MYVSKLSLAKFPQVFKVYSLNLNKSANARQALCTRVLLAPFFRPIRYLLLGARDKAKAFSQMLSPRLEGGVTCRQNTCISHSRQSFENLWSVLLRVWERVLLYVRCLCGGPDAACSRCPFHSTPVGCRAEIRSVESLPPVNQHPKKRAGRQRCLSWI